VLERQKAEGILKRMVCLTVNKEHGPFFGMESIYRNGKNVGFVRRAAFGHHVGKSIAYGYITKEENQRYKIPKRESFLCFLSTVPTLGEWLWIHPM